jgi:hypothetical protein
MKRLVIVCAAIILLGPAARAGVVIQMQVKATDTPQQAHTEAIYAQGEMLRMDARAAGGKESSVIFRDQTMYFVDHAKKACQKIDKKGLDQLGEQLGAMMKQLESLPPEQRAMMEKMMQGKMPGGSTPATRRVEVGGQDQVGEYPCSLHTVYADDQKIQEVCLADPGVGSDMAEAMDAFHALAQFAAGLMKVAQDLPFGKMLEVPYQEILAMDGFPVRTRLFNAKGEAVLEKTVDSVTRREIEPEAFAVPKGYKVQSLEQELQHGR